MSTVEDRRAVVFGANGSIGSEIVRQTSAMGIDTVAVVRPGKGNEVEDLAHVTAFEADYNSFEDLATSIEGATEIYYTPANFNQGRIRPEPIRDRKPGKAFVEAYNVNVEIPRSIQILAEQEGVEHMLYLSSIAVYGSESGVVSEDSPTGSNGVYGVTKGIAETLLLGNQENTAVNIFRPANVFGRGAKIWSEALYDVFSKRGKFVPGVGQGALPIVDIRDVAKSMITAAEKPGIAGEVYNLAADDTMSIKQIAEYYQLLTDREINLTPAFLALLSGRILDMQSVLTGNSVKYAYESVTNMLDTRRVVSNDKAKQDLGMEFMPSREVIKESLIWVDENHGLGRVEDIDVVFEVV